ncbi:hypothetical protein D9756_010333 [Leucocoprinus leucothites]|uniref:DUF6533 domain-containing protein n=1 Tax=Leucocoprinus leucothites TaxID=201217 RepID=A0A8H5CTR2_9AGAR|nr:hypothetical protein D9756_010333 [Leucoagaricus leucothites]
MSLISEVDITTWRHGRWYAIIAHPMHATMPKYRVVAVHDRAISSLKVPLPHSNYSMDTASALTAAAINDLRSAQMSRYFDYASVAFWIYEFFLVIDLEKSLVWSSRWSAIKIAYLTTKYTFLVECLLLVVTYVYASPTYCKIVYITTDFLIFVAACIAEGLLAYRVWIVLGMGRRLGYILSILCLSGLVLGGGSIWTAVILMGIHGTVPLNTGIFLAGCPPMHHNSPVADLAGFGFLVVICIYVPSSAYWADDVPLFSVTHRTPWKIQESKSQREIIVDGASAVLLSHECRSSHDIPNPDHNVVNRVPLMDGKAPTCCPQRDRLPGNPRYEGQREENRVNVTYFCLVILAV